jgi:hypothetical protein
MIRMQACSDKFTSEVKEMIEEITASEIEGPLSELAGSNNHNAVKVDYHWV